MKRAAMVASVMAVAALAADDAEACGGLFCNAVQPVVQVDERIIFVDHEDDTVTAVVQIAYAGPSEQFAWVIPIDGVPEIGVSSNVAFTRLQAATDPSYTMNTRVEGECAVAPPIGFVGCAADQALSRVADAGAFNEDGIDVLASGSVGPYDYELISVAEITDQDPAAAALRWLDDNGYEATALSADLFRPYLEEGMNLLAFRLNKQADVGEIRPVTLRYPSRFPMIPIKLTSVAAQEDMGVLVWTIAEARAVPLNYKSLELNAALINWFSWQSNYFNVVNAAADEAGGQGFVTEMAQPSSVLDEDV